ncbi:MAG: cytoplasmic protein [Deltaproteobacteria bacterium]|nr:cytoplasmic protein [Deltaproteobacteria bacterium]
MNQNPADQIDFNLDTQNLYREESYTDLKAGAIRRLIPVKADGENDKARTEIFVGTTQLLTPEGPLPVQARLMVNNLQEALEAFPDAMRNATHDMIAQLEEMQKKYQEKEDSRIIVPGQ